MILETSSKSSISCAWSAALLAIERAASATVATPCLLVQLIHLLGQRLRSTIGGDEMTVRFPQRFQEDFELRAN